MRFSVEVFPDIILEKRDEVEKKKEKKRESEDNTPVITPVRKWKAGYSKTLVHTSWNKVHDAFARDMKFLMTRASTLPFPIER